MRFSHTAKDPTRWYFYRGKHGLRRIALVTGDRQTALSSGTRSPALILGRQSPCHNAVALRRGRKQGSAGNIGGFAAHQTRKFLLPNCTERAGLSSIPNTRAVGMRILSPTITPQHSWVTIGERIINNALNSTGRLIAHMSLMLGVRPLCIPSSGDFARGRVA